MVDVYVVLGALAGAIAWNIITWLLALPTSSSHALAGSIAGAAVAKAGFSAILVSWQGWGLLLTFLFVSPLIGFVLGAANMVAVSWLFRRSTPHRVDTLFRRLQLFSAAVFSLGHGGNDAQKTMGVIVLLLVAAGKKRGRRATLPRSGTSTRSPCGSSSAATPPSAWARCSAGGGS